MIRVRRLSEEPGEPEVDVGSLGVNVVDVVLKRNDLKAFGSRILRISPGGHTAFHDHIREHIVVVLNGQCRVETKTSNYDVREAMIITVPSGIGHRFSNLGSERLALLILNLYTEDESKPPEPVMTDAKEASKPEVP